MRAEILGSTIAGLAALGLAACGTSTNNAAGTTSTSAPTSTQVVTKTVTTPSKPVTTPSPQPSKPKPTPKPAPAPAPAPQPSGPTMPNVVGQNLDTATSELDSNAIQYALNSNGEHVILKFDWGVCSTSPAAGQPVAGPVVLNLGHFSCGA